MSRGSDDVAVREGVVHKLSCDQTTVVSDVRHQDRATRICDLTEPGVVEVTRVTGSSSNQNLWLEHLSLSLKPIIVNQEGVRVDEVVLGLEVD